MIGIQRDLEVYQRQRDEYLKAMFDETTLRGRILIILSISDKAMTAKDLMSAYKSKYQKNICKKSLTNRLGELLFKDVVSKSEDFKYQLMKNGE